MTDKFKLLADFNFKDEIAKRKEEQYKYIKARHEAYMIRKEKAEELGVPESSLDLNFPERIISCYTYSNAFTDLQKLVKDYVEEMK